MRFGEKMFELRKRRGMSQEFLAQGMRPGYEISQGYISAVERAGKKGEDRVNLDLALAIATFLRVPLDWMADPSEGMRPDDELSRMQVLRDLIKEMGDSNALKRLASGDVASPASHSPVKPLTLRPGSLPDPGERKSGGKTRRRG